MRIDNLYNVKDVSFDDKITKELKEKLSAWSNDIPHHPYRNFGASVSIHEVFHKPIYLHYLSVQYENRTTEIKKEPHHQQVPGIIPDLSKPKILSLPNTVKPFTNQVFTYRYNGAISGCSACQERGFDTCLDCSGKGKNTCGSCGGTGDKSCDYHGCHGSGKITCYECDYLGQVRVRCTSCNNASGRDYNGNRCYSCNGSGMSTRRCGKCSGDREYDCSWCRGTGRTSCGRCSGQGVIKCKKCNGAGKITCSICDGRGKLIQYGVLTQSFSYKKYDETLCNAEATELFPFLKVGIDEASSDLPVFLKEDKTLPARLLTGHARIDEDYYTLQKKVLSEINNHVDILHQSFQIWVIDTYQMKCSVDGYHFHMWFLGKSLKVVDGGSPIKNFRDKLLKDSKNMYMSSKFFESHESASKAFEMKLGQPDDAERIALRRIRGRLLLAYDLGYMALALVCAYLFPLLFPFLKSLQVLDGKEIILSRENALTTLSGTYLVFLSSMVVSFGLHNRIVRWFKPFRKVRLDLARFIVGGTASLLLAAVTTGVIISCIRNRDDRVFLSVGKILKTESYPLLIRKSAVNVAEDSIRRKEGVRLLFDDTQSKLDERQREYIYDRLDLRLSDDTKSFVFNSDWSRIINFTVILYPTDLNNDGREELFIIYGNDIAHPRSTRTVLMLIEEANGGFIESLGVSGNNPEIFKNRKGAYPDIILEETGPTRPVYRWDGKKYFLSQDLHYTKIGQHKYLSIKSVSDQYQKRISEVSREQKSTVP